MEKKFKKKMMLLEFIKSRILIISCFAVSLSAIGQNEVSNIVIGTRIIINSEVLNQDREIQVYTPPSYDTSIAKSYPVLYVLDGQEYFLHGIAYQDMLRFKDKTPPFIVIGIKTDRKQRRTLFYQESERFKAFLIEELIPYVDSNYRTAKEKERLYFGWEMAAGLGFEVLADYPTLFSGYMLASPTHSTDKRMNTLSEIQNKGLHKLLFVSAGNEETWIHKDSDFLSNLGELRSSHFAFYENEDHYSTPTKTMHEGLSTYFNDYDAVRLRTLKALKDYGGIEVLEEYYKSRGERYGLSTEIHRETQHFLILSAEKENNMEVFENFIKRFDTYIPTITRDLWINRYARFYLKHQMNAKAISLFNLGLEKFPKSTLILNGLGDAYKANGNTDKATFFYNKLSSVEN
ncbi:alpha/beta hydrolase-fold protein [Urechidicola vernalis]|uniref:Alpha/beta hydrolase-fold protein n=1 Tax=Urechidicola vernalis TaxID=3075600 RepID=A0ABU2Y2C5_9FLAO|nr:alpha/beta hydrolase-fold protein [Urechidicola sp. P050]MDT0551966.1 alpha/beta hydrolase-fold protein [Urechidicola sp. P050]